MGTGKINADYVMIDDFYIQEYIYLVQLIMLDISKLDIILDMKWLIQYNA